METPPKRLTAKLNTTIKALTDYRERMRMLLEGHTFSKQKATGKGLKMQGQQFGDLEIDPSSLWQASFERLIAENWCLKLQRASRCMIF